MIKPNIDVVVNDSCCCAPSTYRTVVLKCNIIGNDNILTQEMISTPLTKYIIKYDYIIDPYPVNGVANIPVTNKIENCCGSDEIIYYSDNFINIPAGKTITIPEDCFLISEPGGRRVNFTVAEQDTLVRIASYTPGVYRYKILKALVLPEKSLIQFDGGSISNGTLVGKDTIVISYLDNEDIFKNVDLKGTFVFTKFGNLTLTEEILEPQAGEKIVPVYKKITIGNGREDVSFNVHSFEVLDILRVIRFSGTNYVIELAKGENQFVFPTAQEAGVNKTLVDGWVINGIHYHPGDSYTITDPDMEELTVEASGWVCTVTFISEYGNISSPIEVNGCIDIEPIVLPEPTAPNSNKDPYYTTIFDGWYLDPNYTASSKLGTEYCPEENVTIYAKWIKNMITIRVYESLDGDTYTEYHIPAGGTTVDLCGGISLENLNIKEWRYRSNPDLGATNVCLWAPSAGPGLYEVFPIYNYVNLTYYGVRRSGHNEDKVISDAHTEQIIPGLQGYRWFPSDWLEGNEVFHWWSPYRECNNEQMIWLTTRLNSWTLDATSYTYINNIVEVTFKFDNEETETINYDLSNPNLTKINFEEITSHYPNSNRVVTKWKIGATGSASNEFWYADTSPMPKSEFNTDEEFNLIAIKTINGRLCNVMPGKLNFYATTAEKQIEFKFDSDGGTIDTILVGYTHNDNITTLNLDSTGFRIYVNDKITTPSTYNGTRTNYLLGDDRNNKFIIGNSSTWSIPANSKITIDNYSILLYSDGNSMTLKPLWTLNVAVDLDGGTFTSGQTNYNIVKGGELNLSNIVVTKENYNFIGWKILNLHNDYYINNGSSEIWNQNGTYIDNEIGHIKIIALWLSTNVLVTFKANNCSYMTVPNTDTYRNSSDKELDGEGNNVGPKNLHITINVPRGGNLPSSIPTAYKIYKIAAHRLDGTTTYISSNGYATFNNGLLNYWELATVNDISISTNYNGGLRLKIEGGESLSSIPLPLNHDTMNKVTILAVHSDLGNYGLSLLENITSSTNTTTDSWYTAATGGTKITGVKIIELLNNNSFESGTKLIDGHYYLILNIYEHQLPVYYSLTTEIPNDFGSLDDSYQIPSGEVLLSSLQGWNNWEGQNNLYILIDTVKTESGNIVTDASKYITLKDASGNPGLEDSFTCTINNSIVSLKWDPAFPGPLDNSTHGNYKIIFK